MTRYHGTFAANAALRAAITPAGRGSKACSRTPERPTPKLVALNWARRLKRVFGIEIEQCARCGGRVQVIASIEEPELIERILARRRGQSGGGRRADVLARRTSAAAGVPAQRERRAVLCPDV